MDAHCNCHKYTLICADGFCSWKDATSYRKVFHLVTAGSFSTLPWNIHSRRTRSWSTKIFEANIFMICKVLPKFMKILSCRNLESFGNQQWPCTKKEEASGLSLGWSTGRDWIVTVSGMIHTCISVSEVWGCNTYHSVQGSVQGFTKHNLCCWWIVKPV